MATNYLPPFANGTGANVIDYATWVTLPDQATGFESGIARSIRCNFPWAEGAAAAHALGELVIANTSNDATIDAASLATNLAASVVQTKAAQTITGAKTFSGAVTITGTFKSNNFSPRTNNTYSLGTASAVWKNVFATTFTGNLAGTADKATGDADGNPISSTYAKLAEANTFSGTNTFSGQVNLGASAYFQTLNITDGANVDPVIFNVLTGSSNGNNVAIGGNSSTFLTSGEAYNLITEDNGFSAGSEHIQLLADTHIYFRTNLNGGWNANSGAVMTSTIFRPLGTDGTMNLGSASNPWGNAYANTFIGNLTGTASQATADASGNVIASTYLPLAGGTMTGVITRNGTLAQSGNASGSIAIMNGTSAAGGGGIWMYGASNANAGKVRLQAYDATNKKYCALDANGDGTLTWIGKNIATQNWVTGQGYAVDSAVVHLAGDETLTGSKTFIEDVIRQFKTFTKGTIPTSNQYVSFAFKDANSATTGGIQSIFEKNTGRAGTRMYTYRNDSSTDFVAMGLIYPTTGDAYGYCPSTPTGSTSNQIATADFVVGLDSNAVHKTGAETVAGAKTFINAPVIDQTATTPTEGELVGALVLRYKNTAGTVINAYPIQYIGGSNSLNNTLAFGSSNGATIIGAGEGGKRIYATAPAAANSESLFLAADLSIFTYAGCANDGSGGTLVSTQSASVATFSVPLNAPTAAAGTATTQVATTAFVANGFLPLSGGAMTGAITSAIETTLAASRATGNVWAATAERTDKSNKVSFGIGSGGVTRGIYDTATSKWIIYCDGTNSASQLNVTDTADDSATHLASTGWVKDVLADYALTSALSSYLPLAGGTMTGSIKRNGIFVQNTSASTYTEWLGGSTSTNGAWMALYGNGSATYPGCLRARFQDGTNSRYMTIKPDGTWLWGTENVATREWVKVKAMGSRTTNGSWSITGLEIGKPLFILHKKAGTSGVCNLAATSGVENGGNNAASIYHLGVERSDVAVFVPSATTVVILCNGMADDKDELYAYQ